MAINLEDHKVYIESHKMDMVPLSIALQAVADATVQTEPKMDEAMDLIKQALSEINNSVKDVLEND